MILVTGGAGVLGSRLVERLTDQGESVRVLTLPGDPNVSRVEHLGCEIFYVDIADRHSLQGACAGVKTVYHLAAIIIPPDVETLRRINVTGTENVLAEAESSGVRHFIQVSSVSASEPDGSEYARSKADAEAAVRGSAVPNFTIVRPTLIYDSRGGQEFFMFFRRLLQFPVVPFVGSGRAMKNPVYSEDIVDGLASIAGNPSSFGKTYNFSGGEEISIRDLARLMLDSVGERRPILPIPLPLCRLAATVVESVMDHPPLTRYGISRIEHEAASDNTSARLDLGYDPVGITEGIKRCTFEL